MNSNVLLLGFYLLSSHLQAESLRPQWLNPCLDSLVKESNIGSPNASLSWEWFIPSINFIAGTDQKNLTAIKVVIEGVVKLSSSHFFALSGQCHYRSKSALKIDGSLYGSEVSQVIDTLKSAHINQKQEVKSPWINTKIVPFLRVQDNLGYFLDALFGETLNEGYMNADVAKVDDHYKVNCTVRPAVKQGIILYCLFDIVGEFFYEQQEEPEAFTNQCSIRYYGALNAKSTSFDIWEYLGGEADEQACLENVSSN